MSEESKLRDFADNALVELADATDDLNEDIVNWLAVEQSLMNALRYVREARNHEQEKQP